LIIGGALWFALFLFIAIVFFLMREMADEPGRLMTVGRALRICLKLVAAGCIGLLISISAYKRSRR
jgi:hypothetical protein